MDRMSYSTSDPPYARVPGNHVFWYCEAGARETTQQLDKTIMQAEDLQNDMKRTLSTVMAPKLQCRTTKTRSVPGLE